MVVLHRNRSKSVSYIISSEWYGYIPSCGGRLMREGFCCFRQLNKPTCLRWNTALCYPTGCGTDVAEGAQGGHSLRRIRVAEQYLGTLTGSVDEESSMMCDVVTRHRAG